MNRHYENSVNTYHFLFFKFEELFREERLYQGLNFRVPYMHSTA